jgi:hypothetical protein
LEKHPNFCSYRGRGGRGGGTRTKLVAAYFATQGYNHAMSRKEAKADRVEIGDAEEGKAAVLVAITSTSPKTKITNYCDLFCSLKFVLYYSRTYVLYFYILPYIIHLQ